MRKLILALAMAMAFSIGTAGAQAATRLQDSHHTFPAYDNQVDGGQN